MDVGTVLENLRRIARQNPEKLQQFLMTADSEDPIAAFCQLAREHGQELYEADLVFAGEEMYAQMKRAQNGGGDTSPMLEGEDDYYEQFLADLRTVADEE